MNQNVSSPSAPVPAYTIETWPVGRLKKYERNARLHSAKQVEQLRDSFRKFGQVWPILVRPDDTIIAGHGRLEAAKAEGYTEVRVIVAVGWSEEQCRAFGLLDNKVALNSEWDDDILADELVALGGLGVDIGQLGFAPAELNKLLPGVSGQTDPDDVPAAPTVPVARCGDLWILGRHRLLCGDSTKTEDVKRLFAGAKPHLMVTDPPYGVNYNPAWRIRAGLNGPASAQGKVSNDDRVDWSMSWKLFDGDVAYVWHSGLHASEVQESLSAAGFKLRAQIVWVKTRPMISRGAYHWQHEPALYAAKNGADDQWRFVPEHEIAAYSVADGATASWCGDRKQSTVWQIEHLRSGTGHGTQKPVECMKRPMENNSAPGQSVYDPFVGSGTSIIAAEMLNRHCLAIEIDPIYVDVVIDRWQQFTRGAATLDGDGRTFSEVAAERLLAA